jgi:sugar/nucleoside kinase (ribokinase family)
MPPSVPSQTIEYLLLGHLAKDLSPDGPRLGGGVAYSGLTAHALGLRVGLVSAAGEDLSLDPLAGLPIVRIPSAQSTTFENRYAEGVRTQRVTATARPLSPADVPPAWVDAGCVHLAPIADELPLDAAAAFPAARVVCTPQGWLRRWDAAGEVTHHPWERLLPALQGVEAVVLGWEDIGHDRDAARRLGGIVPILVLTAGASGADLYLEGSSTHIDAPPARQVDPTGAGDIFAAAFFVGLLRNAPPLIAARRAAALAARSVEAIGLAGVPSAGEIAELEAAAP